MTEQFVPRDTTEIQQESLINFMAASGYEPVYNDREMLVAFSQPRFAKTGKIRIGVNSAIRLHNESAEEVFVKLQFQPKQEFRDFCKKYENIDEIITLFAGTCKIVEFISANFSRKRGFHVHNHNVKFMTKRDQYNFGF